MLTLSPWPMMLIGRAETLPIRTYTTADGLSHNSINKIVRDSRGFLWFCSREGLSLFDGYTFTNYGTDQGLPHANVSDILETREGDYWVATSAGLCKFSPKGTPVGRMADAKGPVLDGRRDAMFTVVRPVGNDRYTNNFTTLRQGRDGTIWCGTWRGLFRVAQNAGHTELLPVDLRLPTKYPLQGLIGGLIEDRYGTLWIVAGGCLYRRWADGSTARYGREYGLPFDTLRQLLEDRRGNLWIASSHDGLLRLAIQPGHIPPVITRHYSGKNGLGADWVFDLCQSSDGKLWVGTSGGLVEFPADEEKQGRPSRVYTKSNGFSYHEIVNVIEDRDGNLWLGTINGAMKIARNGFLTFNERDGIYAVSSLFESAAGEFYVWGYVLGDQKASVFDGAKLDILNPVAQRYWQGIGRFDGQRFMWLMPHVLKDVLESWSSKPVVLQARTGQWWFGTGAGIYLLPRVGHFAELKVARPEAVYTTRDGLASPMIYSIYEDSRGDVWIATTSSVINGLALWERGSHTVRDMARTKGLERLKEKLAVSFQEDRSGNIWVGFSDGTLARYAAGQFSFFPADAHQPAGSINDLYLDREGRLWVATTRGGVSRIDYPSAERPAFVNYSTAGGLSSNFATAITEDLQGRIYVGTGRGVDRITPATGQIKLFTTADGLAPGGVTAAFRDRSGMLWFGANQGLSRFLPEPEQPSLPPPALIKGLWLRGEKATISALGQTEVVLPKLASDKNQLQIDFVGLSFAPGETLRYQYKLEGTDTDWSALTEQRTVNYASLSPGRYRFLVRALNSDGVFSRQPASVTFTILSPIWMRWWFLTLVAVSTGLAGYTLYRYRVARILEVANIRTRIATDLHDDIGANLTKIAILSEVIKQQLGNEDSQTNSPLSTIARVSRESVASMSDIVWAINPKRDSLLELTRKMRQHAEEVFALGDVKLSFTAPDRERKVKLGVDVRRDVFLIFKEAVNNAARHSDCSQVTIDLAAEGSSLSLLIIDDGLGFDLSVESEGEGLTSMRRRAHNLRGTFGVTSRVGQGTTVALTIPLTRSTRLDSAASTEPLPEECAKKSPRHRVWKLRKNHNRDRKNA